MKITKKLLTYILLGFAAISATWAGVTFAWLAGATTEVNIENLNGGVISQYFHCGDGSEEAPFSITRPVHLYNMTQLYENLPGFAEENHHFQLGYDIDGSGDLKFYDYDDDGVLIKNSYSTSLNMNYYDSLEPIGSEEHPFGGTFNGSNLTVDKLNISGDGVSDIGVFGYVTDEAEIKDLYINNLTIDITGAVANAHDAHNTNAHVGYIAGHIDDAACFTNTYVNNCEIIGHSTLTKNDWGYFGRCDNAATLEQFINKAKDGPGHEDTWGGSIAFNEFNQRLYHYLNSNTSQSIRYKNGNTTYRSGLIKTETDHDSAISVHRGGNASTAATYLAQDPASNFVVYNMIGSGTHKINSSSKGTGTTYTAAAAVNGTYEPLLVNADYTTSNKNTGYLTSSQYAYGANHYSAVDGTVRSASYPNGQLANSLDDTYHNQSNLYNSSTGGPKFTYNGNNLEILTNSSTTYSSNNYRLISDDYNSGHSPVNSAISGYTKTNYETLGLTRYKNARQNLETILSSSEYVHGIHFMGVAPSASATVNVPNAIVNGVEKTNYAVLLSTVDFHVKEEGYITLFAGSYYPATKDTIADSFFDLYKVNRNGDNISSIEKIYKIYKDDNDNYTYTTSANQTVSGATLMFDMNYLMNQPPKNNVAYYFEIPVGIGEFAIGAVSGKTAGAYLMYLDLGTNGGEGGESVLVDDFESIEYRSTPNTAEHSILLITYMQQASQNVNLKVIYIEQDKRYNITYSGTLTEIIITVLNTEYYIYFNGTLLPQVIQSNYLN